MPSDETQMTRWRHSLAVLCLIGAAGALLSGEAASQASSIPFTYVVVDSSAPRDMHAKTVGDIDGDGFDDIIAASAPNSDGIYWYQYPDWDKHTIVPPFVFSFSTDMQVADIDRDGDLDLVAPRRNLPRDVRWFENPRPTGNPATDAWTMHVIGAASAHDVEIADVNQDGWLDVVVREDSTKLFVQDGLGGWSGVVINSRPSEGLSLADIDLDGDIDAAINGYWLENPLPLFDPSLAPWDEHLVDITWPEQVGVRVDDFNGDGRPDIAMGPSESASGRLSWYDAPFGPTGTWVETVIDATVSYLHTFKSADMDLDGDLDLVTAEMEQSADPDEVSVYLNEGAALLWSQQIVATTGSHNLRVTDIGKDGDIDIVGANWLGVQLLEMWRNDLDPRRTLDSWQRHVIDDARPWRAVFVATADLDGDNLEDIVTGAWWYRNPGSAGGAWTRGELGSPLANMAAVHDFDRDGDLDVLGTRGQGAQANDSLVWARNDGGTFTVLGNIEVADGDFLQGVAVAAFDRGAAGRPGVMLSWHDTTTTVQMLDVPADPSQDTWTWTTISTLSQSEDLSTGDIDRDGDADVLLGTRWLRNDGFTWTPFDLFATGNAPDRNELADINRDGRLDAVVGYEAISVSGTIAWYEQSAVATDPWTEHVIGTVIGPMSLDVVDMDGDGDLDVVVGEHNLAAPSSASLFVFENVDGAGGAWTRHTVYTGDEHHDGARVTDLDHDGDMDVVSIGWSHNRVVVYENLALTPGGGGALNRAPVASLIATPTSGAAPLIVVLDASASYDVDGDSLSFLWDFGDGSAPGSGAVVGHAYAQDGSYNARVTVGDGLLEDIEVAGIFVGTSGAPSDSLVHHWRFDEATGSVAGDSIGTSDGTVVAPAAFTLQGKTGSALTTNGVGGRVDVGAIDIEGELTLALWMKANNFGVPDGRFITKATGTANADHYWMLSTIGGTALRFRLKTNGITDVLATATGVLETGRWTHVAATYDGQRMRIYKDGVELASTVKTGAIDVDPSVMVAIGNQPAGAGNLPFDGSIDDVRIYNRALTAAEVDSLVTYRLTLTVSGGGTIARAPQAVAYMSGQAVVVTAVPDFGWAFGGWSGDLAGTQNPDTITVSGDATITATFVATADVPTAGEYAMMLLLGVLLTCGAAVIRRRRSYAGPGA